MSSIGETTAILAGLTRSHHNDNPDSRIGETTCRGGGMDLIKILDNRAVRSFSGVPSKSRLLQLISEQASIVYGFDSKSVHDALADREKLGSTGVGRGIAIPHARMDQVTEVVGLFTRIADPIEFDSIDKQPVDLVFTLLAPANSGAEHLKALAMVSRTLRDEDICRKLRANHLPQKLFAILTQTSLRDAA